MPRVLKSDLVSELQHAAKRATIAEHALTLTLCEVPECVRRVQLDEAESYEYRLYGSRYSHGGVVVRVFRCAGQSDQIEASYLDDQVSAANNNVWPLAVRIAIGELKVAQRQAIAVHGWHECGKKDRQAMEVHV